MNLFRINGNWIRHRTKNEITNSHNELYRSYLESTFTEFKKFIIDSKSWWFIIMLVFSIFVISSFWTFEYLNLFDITYETSIIVVDQRTGNIAAITSITLVVIGFMINNLAVKEAFAYKILFKHSYLYPIIYFILSVIGFFIIISTLRNELNENLFVRLVISGTYLALIVLFLIGFLFSTIIKFSNNIEIKKLIEKELIEDAKQTIRISLISKISGKIFSEEMNKLGLKKYDFIDYFNYSDTVMGTSENTEPQNIKIKLPEKIITDINIEKIIKFIKNKSCSTLVHNDLILNSVSDNYDNYIFDDTSDLSKYEKSYLKNCLILKKANKNSDDNESVREYFDNKFEEYSNNGNYKDLENILDSYYKLYKIEIKHQI